MSIRLYRTNLHGREFYTHSCCVSIGIYGQTGPAVTCVEATLYPKSMAGYIETLDDQNKYGFDLIYDLKTKQYIERCDVYQFYGHKVFALIVDRQYYFRVVNRYHGDDTVRPIFDDSDPEMFILKSDSGLFNTSNEIDVSKEHACDCYEMLQKSSFSPTFIAQLGDLSKSIRFGNKPEVFHPVWISDQDSDLSALFHRDFSNLNCKANNIVRCSPDGPVIYLCN